MEALIPTINKLQGIFNDLGDDRAFIPLPRIAVLGGQSSGKSSVLENIVGRDFLPRGVGMVTRVPLILQLHNEKSISENEEYGIFSHSLGQKFNDFTAIRDEISRRTDEICKNEGKEISETPITLSIYSPNLLDLTLVDLPGIIRNVVDGQDPTLPTMIKRMVLQQVSDESTIILAIHPANTDIATSDAISAAKAVDPERVRTIGVLTKVDLVQKGMYSETVELLAGKKLKLSHGFIAVRNRGADEVNASLEVARASETSYFRSHPDLSRYQDRCGTAYLSTSLNKILLTHIRKSLPSLKLRVDSMLSETRREVLSYGPVLADRSQGSILLELLTKFSASFSDTIEGRSAHMSSSELAGGARISYIFNEIFTQGLKRIDPWSGVDLDSLRTQIRNAMGARASLFIPENSFERIVKDQVLLLKEPARECATMVFEELSRMISSLEDKQLEQYSVLKSRVIEVVMDLLTENLDPTLAKIDDFIAIEHAFINVSHPDFIGGHRAMEKLLRKRARDKQAEQRAANGTNNRSSNGGNNGNGSNNNINSSSSSSSSNNNNNSGNSNNINSGSNNRNRIVSKFSGHGNSNNNNNNGGGGGGGGDDDGEDRSFFNYFGFGSKSPGGKDSYNNKHERETKIRQAQAHAKAQAQARQAEQQQQQQQQQQQRTNQNTLGYGAAYANATGGGSGPTSSFDTYGKQASLATLDNVPTQVRPGDTQMTENERDQTEVIQILVTSYFQVVRKTISDVVPKAIMHFLVNESKKRMHERLVSELYKPDLFEELLAENSDTAARRKAAIRKLEVLQRAQQTLNELGTGRYTTGKSHK